MKTYYIDAAFRVHVCDAATATANGWTAWNDATGEFNGKCKALIEGYRVVPNGATWTRADGVVFTGLMIAPAVDSEVLEAAQEAYAQAASEAAEKTTLLSAQVRAMSDRNDFVEDCIAEMAMRVY